MEGERNLGHAFAFLASAVFCSNVFTYSLCKYVHKVYKYSCPANGHIRERRGLQKFAMVKSIITLSAFVSTYPYGMPPQNEKHFL